MKKFFRILSGTVGNPGAVFDCFVGGLCLLAIAVACGTAIGIDLLASAAEDSLCNLFGDWPANLLFVLSLPLLLAADLAALVAFVRAFLQGRWRRALVQALLWLGFLALFATALRPAIVLGSGILSRRTGRCTIGTNRSGDGAIPAPRVPASDP